MIINSRFINNNSFSFRALSLPYFTEILGYKNQILCSQLTKAISNIRRL